MVTITNLDDFFDELCDTLSKSPNFISMIKAFTALKTDVERIEFVSKLDALKDISLAELNNVKCEQKSQQLLKKARGALMNCNPARTIKLCNEALRYSIYQPQDIYHMHEEYDLDKYQ